jgi:hypothetical protein
MTAHSLEVDNISGKSLVNSHAFEEQVAPQLRSKLCRWSLLVGSRVRFRLFPLAARPSGQCGGFLLPPLHAGVSNSALADGSIKDIAGHRNQYVGYNHDNIDGT